MTLKALQDRRTNRLPGGAARPSHDDVKSSAGRQQGQPNGAVASGLSQETHEGKAKSAVRRK